MSPKDEIQDSDDDGGDFSPVRNSDAGLSLQLHEHEKADLVTVRGSDMTDMSFFEQIYNEQKASPDALLRSAQQTSFQGMSPPNEPGSLADITLASGAAPGQGEVHLVDGSFLMSSITDPATVSRPARSMAERRPLSGLTEVTTPSQPSGDTWELPVSPERAPQETTVEGYKAALPWKENFTAPSQPLGDNWALPVMPVSPERASQEATIKSHEDAWKKNVTTPSQPGEIWELSLSPERASQEAIIKSHKAELPWKKNEAQKGKQKTYGKVSRKIRSSPRHEVFATTSEADLVETHNAEPSSNASPGTNLDVNQTKRLPSSSVVIPQTDEQLQPTRRPLKRKADAQSSSFVDDTYPGDVPASLFVVPSALSSSQKKQYEAISITSQEKSEPTSSSKAVPSEAKSSASAATIAYPTPTQFASSRSKRAAAGKGRSLDESGADGVDGLSSPDVISTTETTRKRKKAKGSHEIVHLSSEADASASTRGARKKAETEANNETSRNHVSSDADVMVDRETCNSRPSRRRSRGTILPVVSECEETQESNLVDQGTPLLDVNTQEVDAEDRPLPDPVLEDAVTTVKTAKPKGKKGKPPKKRALRKKGAKSEETVPEEAGDEHVLDRPEVSPTEPEILKPTKRKRGRTTKSATSQAPSVLSQDFAVDDTEHPADGPVENNKDDELDATPLATADDADSAPPPKKKRKGKAKALPDEPALADDNTVETEDPATTTSGEKVLGDISHNSCASVEPKPDEGKHADPPTDSKENVGPAKAMVKDPAKPGSLLPSGKVQYRVGLSKRSRIAPLLKMVRK